MGWNSVSKKKKPSSRNSANSSASFAKNTLEKPKINSPSSNTPKNEKSSSGKKKKIWSSEALIKALEPSKEELKFREEKSKAIDLQQYSEPFKCTKCNRNLKLNSEEVLKVQTHPCLGVLMCQNCCDYYENGEFSLDSEGEDKYCRWCGEGGTIFGCSQCICGFCITCIKKHFGFEYLRKVQKDDDWLCFFCNPKPLWDKRYICSLALQMFESKSNKIAPESSALENKEKDSENHKTGLKSQHDSIKKQDILQKISLELSDSDSSTDFESWGCKFILKDKGRKRIYSSSSDESEIKLPESKMKKLKFSKKKHEESTQSKENFENLKLLALKKLEKILKLSGYQLTFGMNWSSKMLKKLSDPKHITTAESLKNECEKIKCFLSVLSSCLVEFCNSVDSVERNLSISVKADGFKNSSNFSEQVTEPTGLFSVMQFLNFVTNQVKMFMKKGLTLPDILEAEIYDDNKFIGIKKKFTGSTSNEGCSTSLQSDQSSFGKNCRNILQNTKAEDKSRNKDSLQLTVDQESEFQEGNGNVTNMNNPGTSLEDAKNLVTSKEDILQILKILENS